jgi:PAS domain S-box-containing protein
MGVALRALVLEDSQADAELVVAELRRAGFDPDWVRVEAEREYLAELDSMPQIILSDWAVPQIILADWAMPQLDGGRALELLKERGLNVPFIIVSGTIGEDVAVEAMKQGAADYLLKDRLARLGQAVSHALEQNRAEQRLRLQAAALESVANGIVITDRDGRITWVNPAFTRLTGYTAEEAIGQNPRLLKSGEQDQAFYRDLWETVLAGRGWHGELLNRRKDGSLYVDEQTITPVRDGRGELSHFIAVKQDITERKEMEKALRESEDLYRTLVGTSPEAITLTDLNGKVLFCNLQAARLQGFQRAEEVVGQSAFDFIAPEDRPLALENEKRMLEAGGVTSIEYSLLRRDGSRYPAELSASLVVDAEGKPKAFMGIVRDITERKRAEKTLHDAEERYRTLIERIPAIVYLSELGEPAPWIYVSPQAESILGYPAEEWIGDEWLYMRLVHPDDLERTLAVERRSRTTGEPFACEYRMRARDGRIVWVRDEAEVVPGEPAMLRGIMYDITARKVAEEELAQNSDQLRRTDQARRLLLSKLVTAQEAERRRIAAELHDDAIQAMTAVGLRLHSQMGKDAKEQVESLAKLEGIVAGTVARLRHMLFELQPRGLETGSLAEALREYVDFSGDEDDATTVDIEDRLTKEPPTEVRFVGYRIAQEALNNVRKHAQATRVAVLLEERAGGVLVRIRDDGVGFDQTVDPPLGHLGLTSMRERADLAGGWSRVKSRLGAGTTIEFWLPLGAQLNAAV